MTDTSEFVIRPSNPMVVVSAAEYEQAREAFADRFNHPPLTDAEDHWTLGYAWSLAQRRPGETSPTSKPNIYEVIGISHARYAGRDFYGEHASDMAELAWLRDWKRWGETEFLRLMRNHSVDIAAELTPAETAPTSKDGDINIVTNWQQLLDLIDKVWNAATESEEVPHHEWASRLIADWMPDQPPHSETTLRHPFGNGTRESLQKAIHVLIENYSQGDADQLQELLAWLGPDTRNTLKTETGTGEPFLCDGANGVHGVYCIARVVNGTTEYWTGQQWAAFCNDLYFDLRPNAAKASAGRDELNGESPRAGVSVGQPSRPVGASELPNPVDDAEFGTAEWRAVNGGVQP